MQMKPSKIDTTTQNTSAKENTEQLELPTAETTKWYNPSGK